MSENFTFGDGSELERARERAQAWVARFAPLVMEDEVLSERQIRSRLTLVQTLEGEAGEVRRSLQELGDDSDNELQSTLNRATDQLPSLEEGLRSQLGLVRPGDPASLADLNALNDRLAERTARQEMGLKASELPEVLDVKTSPPNWAAAGGLSVFAFAWLSFTTFHAVMMIGGMMQVFGLWSLALLGFYSLFFGAGFMMVAGAVQAASAESISLDQRKLTVTRKMGRWVRSKTYTLPAAAKASIGRTTTPAVGSNRKNGVTPAVIVADVDGKQVSFGTGQSPDARRDLMNRVNAYLRGTPQT